MGGRGGRHRARPPRLLAILLVAAIVGAPLASGAIGSARADLLGTPQFVGFVTDDGYFFVEVGISSFGTFSPVSPGSNVFGTGFTLVFFGLTGANRSIPIAYTQYDTGGTQYHNFSVAVPARAATFASMDFPISPSPTPATLVVDGTTLHYTVETPVLLIPLTNLTNGGFDLILLGILSELLLFALPLMVLARWMTRRALYAPKLKAILWLHGIVLGIAAFVVINFQLFDETLGGWGWFTYPIPIAIFLFFWSASLFNRAEVVEILRPYTASGHRLSFDRWEIRVGRNRHGDLILTGGRSWLLWLYAALDHWVILSPHDAEERGLEPQGHELTLRELRSAIPTTPVKGAREKGVKRIRWPRASKERPEDDFRVRNAQDRGEDDPALIYFVASTDPVSVEWPHLSLHRWKATEPTYDDEGYQVSPAGKKWALTWPHIVDGKAEIQLASIHYADVMAVGMGWKTVEDVVKVSEKRHLQVYLLLAHMENEISRRVEEKLTAFLDLKSRPGFDLTEEEEIAEVERGPAKRSADAAPEPTRRPDRRPRDEDDE